MAEAVKYRRTHYLISTKFQFKYAGLILALVFLTGLLCAYVVYYTTMLLLGDKLANVYPQGRLLAIVKMVNIRILLSMVLVAPLVLIVGIFASHKIAGPIYRIEKFLEGMASGDYSSILSLRKKDELVGIANGINRVLDNSRVSLKNERAYLEKIAILLDNLKSIAEAKPFHHDLLIKAVDKLGEEVREINKEVEKYKI